MLTSAANHQARPGYPQKYTATLLPLKTSPADIKKDQHDI